MRGLPYVLAFVLGLGAAGLTACGAKTNEAMLPAENAEELTSHLDEVLAAVEGEDCNEAERAVRQVESDLQSLPSKTSVRLQERLREGVDRLKEQSAEECEGEAKTQTTETVPTTTETVPTTTTVVPTVPPETTPTIPPETTPTVPPETTPPPPETVPEEQTGGVEAVE